MGIFVAGILNQNIYMEEQGKGMLKVSREQGKDTTS